uniref:C-type lectin domain family 2 member B-like n=1 Tax=Podarcis muralis TaxID=64176 RepID=UPI0010A06ED1|nr:C-type lectin domain family 2 member B-like [Podarcis muralis]
MGFSLWQEIRGKRKGAQPAQLAVHRERRRSRILFMESSAKKKQALFQHHLALLKSERDSREVLTVNQGKRLEMLLQSGGESNQTSPDGNYSAALRAACPAGWIVYEGKCYFFSEEERNWTSAQRFCISQGSSLATIQSELEKVFMLRFKGEADHWIGLRKDFNDTWIWADGSEYSNTLVVKGSENCAYLSKEFAIASRCHIPIKWICSHPDAYMRNVNSTAGKIR